MSDQNSNTENQSANFNFSTALSGLQGVSLEDLQKMMKETQRALKEKEAENAAAEEEKLQDQLGPYEDRLAQIDKGHQAAVEEIEARIVLLREEKRNLQLNHADEKIKFLTEYNEFRKTLNLRPKTLRGSAKGTGTGTRQRRGELHKYDINWKNDGLAVTVKVDKDDNKVFTVDLSDGIPHVRQVEESLTGFGIDIGGGGMARGLVNRIRKMQLEARNEKMEEASSAVNA